MRYETLGLLRCPVGCAGELRLDEEKARGSRVEQGRLVCGACGNGYAIEEHIARMLPPGLGAETKAEPVAVALQVAIWLAALRQR